MAFFFAVRNGTGPALRWTSDRIDAVAAELHASATRCMGYVVPITPSSESNCGVFGMALQHRHATPLKIMEVLAKTVPDLEFSAPTSSVYGPFVWPAVAILDRS